MLTVYMYLPVWISFSISAALLHIEQGIGTGRLIDITIASPKYFNILIILQVNMNRINYTFPISYFML